MVFTEIVEPGKNSNFSFASFTFRLREKDNGRYFLVLLPGYNESGEHLAHHPRWIDFADSTGGMIIAATFKSRPREEEGAVHYAAARHGSGSALERSLNRMANRLGRPELGELPLLIYGHSAGGQFAHGYSCLSPDRLIGFVSVKGGIYFSEPLPQTYDVPALMISGETDRPGRRIAIRKLFETYRKNTAPWCWMEEKNAGHSEGQCLSVAIPYLKGVLNVRLAPGDQPLKKTNLSRGIWVKLSNHDILDPPDRHCVLTHERVGWLPGKEVFEIFKSLDNGTNKYQTE